ncbi:MAG: PepSY domain-containing protein [Nevskiaceae bacterium]|nr:MAG: PepSY domain-containing protein [Nevskiaceae bacterium]TBR73061.1 MAG: PepSY domain-containing protein [Nevskiaceae bacterium]
MANASSWFRPLRSLHLYIGAFTAPALLFFAFTGILQTFGLHEPARDGSYRPAAWVASIAHLHKKQSLEVPVRRALPAVAGGDGLRHGPGPNGVQGVAGSAPRPVVWPMQVFFTIVALSLALSVLSGLYMSWCRARRPRILVSTLAVGVVVPLLLLA